MLHKAHQSFHKRLQQAQLSSDQTALLTLWFKKLPTQLQVDLLDLLGVDNSALPTLATFLERKRNALQLHDRAAWDEVVRAETAWLISLTPAA